PGPPHEGGGPPFHLRQLPDGQGPHRPADRGRRLRAGRPGVEPRRRGHGIAPQAGIRLRRGVPAPRGPRRRRSGGARPRHPSPAHVRPRSRQRLTATVDILHPERPKRVLLVASNPAVSSVTGWPVGFWWAELTHPWWEFTEHGYEVEIASPDGGALRGDSWSDPRDESGYSAHDLISLGFMESPQHAALVESTTPLAEVAIDDYDAVLFV